MSLEEEIGEIKINNEVVTTVVSIAAMDVDGIASLVGTKSTFADMLGRKDGDKGITVEIHDNTVTIGLEVNVEYGYEIYKVAHQLQIAVKSAVEKMAGLQVGRVNVTIRGISVHPANRQPASPAIVESIAEAE